MTESWVVIDPTPGYVQIERFNTEAEAVAAAERALGEERKHARDDGFSEDVEGICVCRVTHRVLVNKRIRPECECEDLDEFECECEASEFGEWDELWDPVLERVPEKP